MVLRKLKIMKQRFNPDARARANAAQATAAVDARAMQEAIGLERRRGGAEARSDQEDQALRTEYEAVSEPVPAVEIIEDD
jgi:hypothetical protein